LEDCKATRRNRELDEGQTPSILALCHKQS
jgi:hypothetical protein